MRRIISSFILLAAFAVLFAGVHSLPHKATIDASFVSTSSSSSSSSHHNQRYDSDVQTLASPEQIDSIDSLEDNIPRISEAEVDEDTTIDGAYTVLEKHQKPTHQYYANAEKEKVAVERAQQVVDKVFDAKSSEEVLDGYISQLASQVDQPIEQQAQNTVLFSMSEVVQPVQNQLSDIESQLGFPLLDNDSDNINEHQINDASFIETSQQQQELRLQQQQQYNPGVMIDAIRDARASHMTHADPSSVRIVKQADAGESTMEKDAERIVKQHYQQKHQSQDTHNMNIQHNINSLNQYVQATVSKESTLPVIPEMKHSEHDEDDRPLYDQVTEPHVAPTQQEIAAKQKLQVTQLLSRAEEVVNLHQATHPTILLEESSMNIPNTMTAQQQAAEMDMIRRIQDSVKVLSQVVASHASPVPGAAVTAAAAAAAQPSVSAANNLVSQINVLTQAMQLQQAQTDAQARARAQAEARIQAQAQAQALSKVQAQAMAQAEAQAQAALARVAALQSAHPAAAATSAAAPQSTHLLEVNNQQQTQFTHHPVVETVELDQNQIHHNNAGDSAFVEAEVDQQHDIWNPTRDVDIVNKEEEEEKLKEKERDEMYRHRMEYIGLNNAQVLAETDMEVVTRQESSLKDAGIVKLHFSDPDRKICSLTAGQLASRLVDVASKLLTDTVSSRRLVSIQLEDFGEAAACLVSFNIMDEPSAMLIMSQLKLIVYASSEGADFGELGRARSAAFKESEFNLLLNEPRACDRTDSELQTIIADSLSTTAFTVLPQRLSIKSKSKERNNDNLTSPFRRLSGSETDCRLNVAISPVAETKKILEVLSTPAKTDTKALSAWKASFNSIPLAAVTSSIAYSYQDLLTTALDFDSFMVPKLKKSPANKRIILTPPTTPCPVPHEILLNPKQPEISPLFQIFHSTITSMRQYFRQLLFEHRTKPQSFLSPNFVFQDHMTKPATKDEIQAILTDNQRRNNALVLRDKLEDNIVKYLRPLMYDYPGAHAIRSDEKFVRLVDFYVKLYRYFAKGRYRSRNGLITNPKRVIIVGAGPVGLLSALRLWRSGAESVRVIEKASGFHRYNSVELIPMSSMDSKSTNDALWTFKKFGLTMLNSTETQTSGFFAKKNLQQFLAKVALIVGVKVQTNRMVTMLCPPNQQSSDWRLFTTVSSVAKSMGHKYRPIVRGPHRNVHHLYKQYCARSSQTTSPYTSESSLDFLVAADGPRSVTRQLLGHRFKKQNSFQLPAPFNLHKYSLRKDGADKKVEKSIGLTTMVIRFKALPVNPVAPTPVNTIPTLLIPDTTNYYTPPVGVATTTQPPVELGCPTWFSDDSLRQTRHDIIAWHQGRVKGNFCELYIVFRNHYQLFKQLTTTLKQNPKDKSKGTRFFNQNPMVQADGDALYNQVNNPWRQLLDIVRDVFSHRQSLYQNVFPLNGRNEHIMYSADDNGIAALAHDLIDQTTVLQGLTRVAIRPFKFRISNGFAGSLTAAGFISRLNKAAFPKGTPTLKKSAKPAYWPNGDKAKPQMILLETGAETQVDVVNSVVNEMESYEEVDHQLTTGLDEDQPSDATKQRMITSNSNKYDKSKMIIDESIITNKRYLAKDNDQVKDLLYSVEGSAARLLFSRFNHHYNEAFLSVRNLAQYFKRIIHLRSSPVNSVRNQERQLASSKNAEASVRAHTMMWNEMTAVAFEVYAPDTRVDTSQPTYDVMENTFSIYVKEGGLYKLRSLDEIVNALKANRQAIAPPQ